MDTLEIKSDFGKIVTNAIIVVALPTIAIIETFKFIVDVLVTSVTYISGQFSQNQSAIISGPVPQSAPAPHSAPLRDSVDGGESNSETGGNSVFDGDDHDPLGRDCLH